jgi:O-antigen biosynthesis protein
MRGFLERAVRYQRVHGTRTLVREGVTRSWRAIRSLGRSGAGTGTPGSIDAGWVSGQELAAKQSQQCSALRLFPVSARVSPRVNIVTDSINRGSLYGGVGTAMILACLIAQARGASLRIVTRTERAQPSNLDSVLSTYGIRLDREVEFAFAPFYGENYEIDACDNDLFVTTSWWTTAATLRSVPTDRILYLLQEDERMFYPHGDEHLLCSRILRSEGLQFAVNTQLLFDHFVASGLDNVARNGVAFEPAFPPEVFRPRPGPQGKPRTLAFYARPNNARNLFYFGIELLEAAVARGIVRLDEWEIVFVGKDIPKIRLDSGRYSPRRLENLTWTEYAAFVGTVDLGLSLMYTPHPSYPPLDMSASGAVVVTNRFGNKRDLSGYCANILCGEPDLDSMLATLAQGVALAADEGRRTSNYEARRLSGDWRQSLAGVVERFGKPG